MSSWLFPSNDAKYRLTDAFLKLNEIDWRKTLGAKADDIVYIYRTRPVSAIQFKTCVIQTDIPFANTIDDREFWNREYYADNCNYTFARLRLLDQFSYEELNFANLKKHGLNGPPQRAMRVPDELEQYIESVLGQKQNEEAVLPEEIVETGAAIFTEGAVTQITVNRHERSGKAKADCIRIYGTACVVCGFDAAQIYGEAFKGRIHVHHLIPLADVGKEYKVNPETDLRPVCPNCHMILHANKDATMSIQELREIIKQK